MPNYAVVDCGTNTFHLLIAAPAADGSFTEVYRESRFVKLAEEGIGKIGEAAFQRALQTLEDYSKVIAQHEVVATRVSGTAALRTATNGQQLVEEVAARTGLAISIIPGKEEAQLIYRGVRDAIGPQVGRWLVMDIGGGSVEFIIVDEEGVRWFESFPIGVAVLYKQFHHTEPISAAEVEQTRLFLNSQLVDLQLALARFPTQHLVGAAGTFDIIANLLGKLRPTPHSAAVDLDGFAALYDRLLRSTYAERLVMPNIPTDRADMIVVAFILIQLVLEKAQINQLTVSSFSMKEGMLAQMLTLR
ncbi:MAG: hypothetical protein DA408_02440 [Bacteroidetes bacterium]|nr:MAG: hypothetical protein C7N36_02990 [Bacteroidota bacterium]PTM14667.1 MAG: hypothetical protein DA408_02440 [Bacteroidota bacterium]